MPSKITITKLLFKVFQSSKDDQQVIFHEKTL